jgi:hypothetical protein
MGGVSNKTTSHITRVLDLTYFSRLQRSKLKKSVENQLRAITPELMAGSTPNFNHRYIYLLGIFYGFFTLT